MDKNIYVVEVSWEELKCGRISRNSAIAGVFEDLDDAIESALANSDDKASAEEIRDEILKNGMSEVFLNNFRLEDGTEAYQPLAIISEEVLIGKKS